MAVKASTERRLVGSVVVRMLEDICDVDPTSISRSIFVTGFKTTIKAEDLIVHFQRERNGGGDIESVTISKRGTAVITFDSPQVVTSVLQHDHKFKGVTLKVEPYLDSRLTNDDQHFEMPTQPQECEDHEFHFDEDQIEIEKDVNQTSLAAASEGTDDVRNDEMDYGHRSSITTAEVQSFEIEPKIWKVFVRVHKEDLDDIETEFQVEILRLPFPRKKITVKPKETCSAEGYSEACNRFINLYQQMYQRVKMERFSLKNEKLMVRSREAISRAGRKFPVSIELSKDRKHYELYGEESHIAEALQYLEEEGVEIKNETKNTFDSHATHKKPGVNKEAMDVDTAEYPLAANLSGNRLETLMGKVKVSVYKGDITTEQVDVIVNAANEDLQHVGGIAKAILVKGGKSIEEESRKIIKQRGKLGQGQVVITNPGNLPCRAVVHAVGPQWRKVGATNSKKILRRACLNSLVESDIQGMASIALPAIGSGIYGMPENVCAEVMLDTVEEFIRLGDPRKRITDIRLVNVDEPSVQAFRKEFSNRYGCSRELKASGGASSTFLPAGSASGSSTAFWSRGHLGASKEAVTAELESVQGLEKGSNTSTEPEILQLDKIRRKEQKLSESLLYHLETKESTTREQQRYLKEERQQKAILQERLRDKEETVDQLQRTLAQERQARSRMEEQIRQARISYNEVEERLQTQLLSSRSLRSYLATRENTIREQQRHLEEQQQQKATLQERLRDEERTVNQLQRTLAQEQQARSMVEEKIRQARISHAEVEERLQAELLSSQTLQSNLETRESTIRDQQRRLEEEVEQRATVQERLRSLEVEMEEERIRHLSTERELQSRFLADEQASAEYPGRQSCDWTIQRAEVVLSDKILGRGAWGEVREGTFRACQVAVKEMHELILSEYNRGLFEREMNIAARCRHPNLLQFIGATKEDGSPLFVTELLDTSLRHILHQRSLSQEEIVVLALDIAKALNYLHLNKPRPIMHRDISSRNVLLWKRGDSWRAKLSDYGAANFMRESMTMNPGAAIYSAPEALTPQQTSKVDVYSFGVLLCEMCIRQQPDPQELHNQIGRVCAAFRGLIQRCVERNPEARPTMGEIISELEKLQ